MWRALSCAQNCNKIEAAILHFDDVATFNCALYDFIAHLAFQMRRVLVTRNSNQTTRSHTSCERSTKCGICGVSAPMFSGRRHILAGLRVRAG